MYRWQTGASDSSIDQFAIPQANGVTNFTASVTGRRVSGAERAAYGLVIRHSDPDSEYVFTVSDFGLYDFALTEKGEYRIIVFPTESSAIKIGQPNRSR